MDIFLAGTALVLAYLVGSVPFAYLVSRWFKGIDIRRVGSGNVGAVNTFRQVGLRAGSVVLAADVLKGVLAVYIPVWMGAPHWTMYYTPIAVVAGHNWPLFLGFRGGKGVATVLGVSLAMLPLITVIATLPAAAIIVVTRNAVLGVALGLILLNALTVATAQPGSLIVLCLLLSVLITATYLAGTWRQYLEAMRDKRWDRILWVE